MFGLFNRKTNKEIYPTPVPEVKPPRDEYSYTVGITQSRQTVLKVGNGYHGLINTLTMNGAAVRQMIRLLEATISDTEEPQGWTCSKCCVDRTHHPCPLGHSAAVEGRCPMIGVAQ